MASLAPVSAAASTTDGSNLPQPPKSDAAHGAKQPHILLGHEDVHPVVIVMGDPARVEIFASLCESSKFVMRNREYLTHNVVFDGQPITLISHGVGSAGAVVCFQELINCGAKCIIRAGTCGSFRPSFKPGHIALSEAAVRADSISKLMLPDGFPTIPSRRVFNALQEAGKKLNVDLRPTITVSSDFFYFPDHVGTKYYEQWSNAGAEAVEMEAAALFALAQLKKVEAGALFCADGYVICQAEDGTDGYDPHSDHMKECKRNMGKVALSAAATLAKHYQ